jgi:hypothetical protein
MKRPDEKTPSYYDKLVKDHVDQLSSVHGYASFFPWHRYMLFTLERELQKSANVMLPYWDWGYDSQSPEKSPIWGTGPLTFGTNGDSKTGCVTTGAFAGHTTFYPSKRCLSRNWGNGAVIPAFTSSVELNKILATGRNYDTYRSGIELPHGYVHNNIGGDMQDPRTSPNDPVFYLHHTNVDRLWWQWQRAYPQMANSYSGNAFVSGGRRGNAGSSDILAPYGVAVSDVMSTEALCYTYKVDDLNNFKPQLPPPTVPKSNGRSKREAGTSPVKVAPAPEEPKLSGTDRSDLTHIRVPDPLPERWIKASGMDVAMVRAKEEKSAQRIKEINSNGTVVEGSLWTRPAALAKIISAGKTEFHADVQGVRVEVTAPEADKPLQVVSNLKEIVTEALKKEGKNIKLSSSK